MRSRVTSTIIILLIAFQVSPHVNAQAPIQRTYSYRIPLFTPVATLEVQVSVDSDVWKVGETHHVSFDAEIVQVSDDFKEGSFIINGIEVDLTPLETDSTFMVHQSVGSLYGPLLVIFPKLTIPFTYTFDLKTPSDGLGRDQNRAQLYFYITYVTSGVAQGSSGGGNYSTNWQNQQFFVNNQGKEIFLTVSKLAIIDWYLLATVLGVIASILTIVGYLESKHKLIRRWIRVGLEKLRK